MTLRAHRAGLGQPRPYAPGSPAPPVDRAGEWAHGPVAALACGHAAGE